MNPPEGSKPFDLAAALAGEPVIMRDGRLVTRLVYDTNPENPAKSLSSYPAGLKGIGYWLTAEGKRQWFQGENESEYDLFMAPKIQKIWVNLYGSSRDVKVGTMVFTSHVLAKQGAVPLYMGTYPYISTIEVEVPA